MTRTKRAIGGLCVTAIFFILIESCFFLAGYSERAPFFIEKDDIDGNNWLITNALVGDNWFRTPEWESRIKTPRLERFHADKSPTTFRVFVLGESAAYGTLLTDTSTWARFLEHLLRESQDPALPQKNIEVINCGIRASTTDLYPAIASELMGYEPDLFILYAGHNEYYGVSEPSAFHQLGLVRWVSQLRSDNTKPDPQNIGIKPQNAIGIDSEIHQRVFTDFQSNLDRFLSTIGDTPLLLMGPVSNDFYAPLGSMPLPRNIQGEVDALIEASEHTPDKVNEKEESKLRQWAKQYPRHSGLRHAAGILDVQKGQLDQAQINFKASVETDTIPLRARENIRTHLASLHDPENNKRWVDLEGVLRSASPNKSIGYDLILDHVHPGVHGSFLIAKAAAEAIAEESDWGILVGTDLIPNFIQARKIANVTTIDEVLSFSMAKRFHHLHGISAAASTPRALRALHLKETQNMSRLNRTERYALTSWRQNNLEVHFAHMQILMEQGHKHKALKAARRSVLSRKGRADAHLDLARLLVANNKLDEARDEVVEAFLWSDELGDVQDVMEMVGLKSFDDRSQNAKKESPK